MIRPIMNPALFVSLLALCVFQVGANLKLPNGAKGTSEKLPTFRYPMNKKICSKSHMRSMGRCACWFVEIENANHEQDKRGRELLRVCWTLYPTSSIWEQSCMKMFRKGKKGPGRYRDWHKKMDFGVSNVEYKCFKPKAQNKVRRGKQKGFLGKAPTVQRFVSVGPTLCDHYCYYCKLLRCFLNPVHNTHEPFLNSCLSSCETRPFLG